MTVATKIHLPGKTEGSTLCGRKARPERIVDELDVVTCDVCLVTDARRDGARPVPATRTIIDRLAERPEAKVPTMKGRFFDGDDPARDRALVTLATLHFTEFLALYRSELTDA